MFTVRGVFSVVQDTSSSTILNVLHTLFPYDPLVRSDEFAKLTLMADNELLNTLHDKLLVTNNVDYSRLTAIYCLLLPTDISEKDDVKRYAVMGLTTLDIDMLVAIVNDARLPIPFVSAELMMQSIDVYPSFADRFTEVGSLGDSIVMLVKDALGRQCVAKTDESGIILAEARALSSLMIDSYLNNTMFRKGYPFTQFIGLYNNGDKLAMVMEYVEGDNILDVKMHNKNYFEDLTVVKDVVKQILSAVVYLNDRGFVHIDLHPGNIMLDQAGKVTIIDISGKEVLLRQYPKGIQYEKRILTTEDELKGISGWERLKLIQNWMLVDSVREIVDASGVGSIGDGDEDFIKDPASFKGNTGNTDLNVVINSYCTTDVRLRPSLNTLLDILEHGLQSRVNEFVNWILERNSYLKVETANKRGLSLIKLYQLVGKEKQPRIWIDTSSGDIYTASGTKPKGNILTEFRGLEFIDDRGEILQTREKLERRLSQLQGSSSTNVEEDNLKLEVEAQQQRVEENAEKISQFLQLVQQTGVEWESALKGDHPAIKFYRKQGKKKTTVLTIDKVTGDIYAPGARTAKDNVFKLLPELQSLYNRGTHLGSFAELNARSKEILDEK